MDVCTCGRLPRMNIVEDCRCQSKIVLHPAPLFWNKKHADADAIKEIYFKGEETEASVEDATDRDFEICRYLGMSTSGYSRVQDNVVPISFVFVDEKTLLGDKNASCHSPFLIRFVNSTTAGDAGEFFAGCRKGLAKFDIPITFKIGDSVLEDSNTNLTAQGYARLVVGAACGDRREALDYFMSTICGKRSLSSHLKARIKRLIREYVQHEV
eukprot:CAMPEP_0194028450 /NCGR_PEP_ID=MMETSP0009_2-20130614/2406_1 /TAXON_ID=210454 /ORGANISM="Grammatophora oceanica, Strain CCMP 410" /LENGTH=211 /DNA_ID=CAMNT_0038667843 /DNA_START=594 /DNA_END=1229 /DNA_ORIENTATION=-